MPCPNTAASCIALGIRILYYEITDGGKISHNKYVKIDANGLRHVVWDIFARIRLRMVEIR